VLDNEYPHIILKLHPWRRLKTIGSERTVPIVGSALWAAKQAIQSSTNNFLFPDIVMRLNVNPIQPAQH
jgi:hypothetical protein